MRRVNSGKSCTWLAGVAGVGTRICHSVDRVRDSAWLGELLA